MTQPVRRLAEGDHGNEDETDDQHAGDDLLAFSGSRFGRDEKVEEHAARL